MTRGVYPGRSLEWLKIHASQCRVCHANGDQGCTGYFSLFRPLL